MSRTSHKRQAGGIGVLRIVHPIQCLHMQFLVNQKDTSRNKDEYKSVIEKTLDNINASDINASGINAIVYPDCPNTDSSSASDDNNENKTIVVNRAVQRLMDHYFSMDLDWSNIMANSRICEQNGWARKHCVVDIKIQDHAQNVLLRVDDLIQSTSDIPCASHNAFKQFVSIVKDMLETRTFGESINSITARIVQTDNENKFLHVMHMRFCVDEQMKGLSCCGLCLIKAKIRVDFQMLRLGIYNTNKLLSDTEAIHKDSS